MLAAGAATERGESLGRLQGGRHDPRTRGLTIQNVELSLLGAVDPYFDAEVHLVFSLDPLTGESELDLEEAFAATRALPAGLQLEVGHFLTEFGRTNPRHPHAWDWLDQPLILTRVFGGEGMRAPGARLGWLLPLPWFAELHGGVQNPRGETMTSFLATADTFAQRPVGGRPFRDRPVRTLADLVYLLRLEQSWDLSPAWTLVQGASAVTGPNATGPGARTWIYGVDGKLKWQPEENFRGWPFMLLEGEYVGRRYRAAPAAVGGAFLPRGTLHDWGFYLQGLYGFTYPWAVGLRVGYATGRGRSFDPGAGRFRSHNRDPFRDARWRFAPVLTWRLTEFSRLRLQYNYDRARHLRGEAHSLWVGLEVLFGSHPAHKY